MSKIVAITFSLLYFYVNANTELSQKDTTQYELLKQNSTIQVQIQEPEKEKSNWGIVYDLLKDFSGTLVAIVGFTAGFFLIRRKLIERHISKALEDIQKANEKTMIESTRLLDEFLDRASEPTRLDKDELREVLEKIKEVYVISQSGSSECQTLLFYLKFTLQNTSKHFSGEDDTVEYLLNSDFYNLIIRTLENVIFYSKQVVTIPKSTRIKSQSILIPRYAKYTTGSKYSTYRHFNLGFIYDANSALFLLFIDSVNRSYSVLLKRSAFKLFWNSNMLHVITYCEKIYAPLKLELPKTDNSNETYSLYLIGFEIANSVTFVGKLETKKEIVKLIYTNPSDNHRYVKSFVKNSNIKNFQDSFIQDSGFSLHNNKATYKTLESVSFEFDLDYLEKLFKKNKQQIKRLLPVKHGISFLMDKLKLTKK